MLQGEYRWKLVIMQTVLCSPYRLICAIMQKDLATRRPFGKKNLGSGRHGLGHKLKKSSLILRLDLWRLA